MHPYWHHRDHTSRLADRPSHAENLSPPRLPSDLRSRFMYEYPHPPPFQPKNRITQVKLLDSRAYIYILEAVIYATQDSAAPPPSATIHDVIENMKHFRASHHVLSQPPRHGLAMLHQILVRRRRHDRTPFGASTHRHSSDALRTVGSSLPLPTFLRISRCLASDGITSLPINKTPFLNLFSTLAVMSLLV